MKIFYQVYNNWATHQCEILKSYGFNIDEGYGSLDVELNEKYKKLFEMFEEWGVEKFVATQFEKSDYKDCTFLYLVGMKVQGFPQPESLPGYLSATYNLKDYCKKCGIGAIQNEPFRLKLKPIWKKNRFFQLNWVYDELFVKKEVYEDVLKKKYDLSCKEVVLHKTGKIIENVVQIDIPTINIPLNTKDIPFETCVNCGRVRYTTLINGYLPSFKKSTDRLHLIKTQEYFGTGEMASQRIYLSKVFFEELKALGEKPNVWPVNPVN